eukprot:CAMPEP_0118918642 /NCGR_PEP_ID=MMETSP1166-20130328/18043_1 /TAXON_ID=1104430 /ORGANISM="Chrysoreinhardia sp, Strain CCMP3193" /LENGTH=543 /DNA_ID=CAMNT_0006858979 /DNA_START=11 /DNA_END=1643 /DNA_ORIENTATION=-
MAAVQAAVISPLAGVGVGHVEVESRGLGLKASRRPTLRTAGLVALTFFSVSGGPFGTELIIKAAGPAFALMGYVAFTMLWSVPEALMTAELSTVYPEAAGFAAWTNAALGPFAAWVDAWCSWVSGVVDNAIYPLLCLAYLQEVTDAFEDDAVLRWAFTLGFVVALTYLCHRGLDLTGTSAIFLTAFVLAPFVVMVLAAIPELEPSRWFRVRADRGGTVKLRGWINNLFWNVNYYDSASAWAGEVDPRRWGRAMKLSVGLCFLGTLLPMLAATGGTDRDYSKYSEGSYVAVARTLAGGWLARWTVVAAFFSNIGLFVSEMSSDAYQIMGMAERGLLPEILCYTHPTTKTPTVAILLSALGVLALHSLTYESIIATENLLYVVSMQLELVAFVTLVRRDPGLSRLSAKTLVLLCAPASILLCLVALIQRPLVWLLAGVLSLFGVAVYFVLGRRRSRRGWLPFRVLDPDWAARGSGGVAKYFGWDDRLLEDDDDEEEFDDDDGGHRAGPRGGGETEPPEASYTYQRLDGTDPTNMGRSSPKADATT